MLTYDTYYNRWHVTYKDDEGDTMHLGDYPWQFSTNSNTTILNIFLDASMLEQTLTNLVVLLSLMWYCLKLIDLWLSFLTFCRSEWNLPTIEVKVSLLRVLS